MKTASTSKAASTKETVNDTETNKLNNKTEIQERNTNAF